MQPYHVEEALHDGPDAVNDEFAEAIERHVEQATGGRILGLYVARRGDALHLHGCSRTYHAREIARQAALEFAEGEAALINHIVVH